MPQEFHRNLILAPNTTTQPERRRGGPLRRGAQKPDNEQQTSSVAMDHNNQSKANELKQKYGVSLTIVDCL